MRRILIIAAIVLAALGTLGLRVVLEGQDALAAGDAAVARDDAQAAIRAYESAARWYLPYAPHVAIAYDRLHALTTSQQTGVALAAWRSIRSAALATRGLWTPHEEDLAAANTRSPNSRLAIPMPVRLAIRPLRVRRGTDRD